MNRRPQKHSSARRLSGLLSLTACFAWLALAAPAVAGELPAALQAEVEKAHGGQAWSSQEVFVAEITVDFGGNRMIDGRMWTDTPVGRTRIELKDGTVLVFDGREAWKAPASSEFQGARFHLLTWPYFAAAPMKLDDPGSHFEELGPKPFTGGRRLPAGRLTFDAGVGDSPDDWYIVYVNPQTKYLAGMAYIVTFGKDAEEAAKEPHAITYSNYQEVGGVVIATQWHFFNWNEEQGIVGSQIGEVQLTNPRFVTPEADTFTAPDGAVKEPAPGP